MKNRKKKWKAGRRKIPFMINREGGGRPGTAGQNYFGKKSRPSLMSESITI